MFSTIFYDTKYISIDCRNIFTRCFFFFNIRNRFLRYIREIRIFTKIISTVSNIVQYVLRCIIRVISSRTINIGQIQNSINLCISAHTITVSSNSTRRFIQHYQLCCDVQLHRSVSRNYAGVNQAWLVCYNRDAFV